MTNQRYQVSATYLELLEGSPYDHQYPRVMGYYDAESSDDAYKQFLAQHAPDVRRAQIFYDDIIVIPVPKTGRIYKLSKIYGELAKFPNEKVVEELINEQS